MNGLEEVLVGLLCVLFCVGLAILQGSSPMKVVVDTNFNKEEQVALISGGGSGHEPAMAGYD